MDSLNIEHQIFCGLIEIKEIAMENSKEMKHWYHYVIKIVKKKSNKKLYKIYWHLSRDLKIKHTALVT